MIYLLSPYTHFDPNVEDARAETITNIMVALRNRGWNAVSPVALCHPIRRMYALPGSFSYWESICNCFLNVSVAAFVIQIQGWNESEGISAELKQFSKPVFYIPYDKDTVANVESVMKGFLSGKSRSGISEGASEQADTGDSGRI